MGSLDYQIPSQAQKAEAKLLQGEAEPYIPEAAISWRICNPPVGFEDQSQSV